MIEVSPLAGGRVVQLALGERVADGRMDPLAAREDDRCRHGKARRHARVTLRERSEQEVHGERHFGREHWVMFVVAHVPGDRGGGITHTTGELLINVLGFLG